MSLPNGSDDIARIWADALGLAEAPLFAMDEGVAPEQHRVLLDGGSGSFAISIFFLTPTTIRILKFEVGFGPRI